MIRIEALNRKQLQDYIDSPDFGEGEFIPISYHRAISQIKNPRAANDDILLLLAYNGEQLAGYLGILPDYLFIADKQIKIAWLSCIYVDKNHRGKKIAQKLVEKSLEIWNYNIILTEYTEPAKRLYNKMGEFANLPPKKKGIRLYLRSDLRYILPPKSIFFERIKPGLIILDKIFNTIFDLRFLFYKVKLNKLKLEYLNEIDTESESFMKPKIYNSIFKRGAEELNWIIKNPWVISRKNIKCFSEKYHFSSLDKTFDFIPVKVKDEYGKVVFVAIFAKRNGRLKIPYIYYDSVEIANEIIKYHLVKWKIKTATIYDEKIVDFIKKHKTPALYKKDFIRNYLISKRISDFLDHSDLNIQDGDGDAGFT